MKKTIVVYGFALAVLLGLLKFIESQYFFQGISLETYIGIIALFFTVFGIWLGSKLINKSAKNELVEESFTPNTEMIKQLQISKREKEVLDLIVEGFSNQEIADKLFVSLSTVKTHSSNLFVKLDVKRRTQAIQKAKSLKIV